MKALLSFGVFGFAVGQLPLLLLAFFSLGMDSEGKWAWAVCGFAVLTLLALFICAFRWKMVWILVCVQASLLGLVVYQTLGDAPLYIGT